MTQSSEITDHVALISEALKQTSKLVEDLKEEYRVQAFPIVLRGLLDQSMVAKVPLLSQQGQHSERAQVPKATRLQAHQSVNEVFRLANPSSHVGRFVCAAYYLLHAKQVECFSMADILDIYGKLRIKKPQNPPDTLNQCIRKAHIIDADAINGQKSWVITPEGEKYVEDLLNASANAKKSAN